MSQRHSTVHPGTLQRWYEHLCRIDHDTLRPLIKSTLTGLRPKVLPASGAVYYFWWTASLQLLRGRNCNRNMELVGPGKRPVKIHIDDEWLGIAADLPIPIYVGKTAVKFNIPAAEAVGRLIDLIKEHDKWIEAPEPATA